MRFAPLIVGTLFVSCTLLSAQQTITYREYEKILSEQLTLDQKYREQIAREQSLIKDYKCKIIESIKRTEEIRQQKLSFLGTTQEHIQSIATKITIQINDLVTLCKMKDQQFVMEMNRINSIQITLDSLRSDPVIKILSIKEKLKDAFQLMNTCKKKIAQINQSTSNRIDTVKTYPTISPRIETYTVSGSSKKSETLFSISEKIYGDPSRWSELYQANKEIIDRNFKQLNRSEKTSAIRYPSDLILPGQILRIPQ